MIKAFIIWLAPRAGKMTQIAASFFFLRVYFVSVHKHAVSNIQPSWPHTWSITHAYFFAASRNLGWEYCVTREENVFVGFLRQSKMLNLVDLPCCEYFPVVNVFTVYGQLSTPFCSLVIFFSVISRFIWLQAARILLYRFTLLTRSDRKELIYVNQ